MSCIDHFHANASAYGQEKLASTAFPLCVNLRTMAIFICTDTRVCRCSLSFLSKDQQERGGSTDYSSSGNWHEAANAFHDRYPKDNIHDLAADISAKGLLNTIV